MPGATFTNPSDIDNKGQIIGTYEESDNSVHGFIRSADGKFTTIDVPKAYFTQMDAINGDGLAVSKAGNKAGEVEIFTYFKGTLTPIVEMQTVNYQPVAISKKGSVTGSIYLKHEQSAAFLYANGKINTLPLRGRFIDAHDVNSHNDVVGRILVGGISEDQAGFLFTNKEKLRLFNRHSIFNESVGINDVGVIAGNFQANEDSDLISYTYYKGVYSSLSYPGGKDLEAAKINDAGQVTGTYIEGVMYFHEAQA